MARVEAGESQPRTAMATLSNRRVHSIKGPHWGQECA